MVATTISFFAIYIILCGIDLVLAILIMAFQDKLSLKTTIFAFIIFVIILIIASIAYQISQVGLVALTIDWLF